MWPEGDFRNFSHHYVKLARGLLCYPLSAQDKGMAGLAPIAQLQKVECCFVLRRVGGYGQFTGPNSGREVVFSVVGSGLWTPTAKVFLLLRTTLRTRTPTVSGVLPCTFPPTWDGRCRPLPCSCSSGDCEAACPAPSGLCGERGHLRLEKGTDTEFSFCSVTVCFPHS